MIAPARVAALGALRAIHGGAALPDALAGLRQRLSDPRDVALAADIVIGTQRWRGTLDDLVASRSSRPLERLDAIVLDILRLSVYQLVHLDRVPASAVVNDAVTLARDNEAGYAAGFVNAVLRRLADPRTRPGPLARPQGQDPAEWADYLARTWAHPKWLVERWVTRLGLEATEARLRYDQSQAPLTIRPRAGVSPSDLASQLAGAGVATAPARFAPTALVVDSGNPWQANLPGDAFVAQDEASQLVALFTGATRGQCVLDACASPGGKTTLMADMMGGTGLVIGADNRPARVRLLADTVRVSGVANVRVVRHDASQPLPYGEHFDVVLVDAPCSGLGTLRRDPDVKWRRTEGDLRKLVRTERRLLSEASKVVRPGGVLVYATCSSEPDENEQVATWLLDLRKDFRADAPTGAWTTAPLDTLISTAGWLQTLPERDGLDAFFAARFRRDAQTPPGASS